MAAASVRSSPQVRPCWAAGPAPSWGNKVPFVPRPGLRQPTVCRAFLRGQSPKCESRGFPKPPQDPAELGGGRAGEGGSQRRPGRQAARCGPMPGPGQDAVLGQLQDVALASLDWGFLEARPGVPRSEHQRQALRSLSCVLCPVGLFVHWTQCDVHWTGSSVQQERCGPQEGTGCRRARPGLAQTVLEVTADKHCVWQLLSTLAVPHC
ncbi:uncharacterized protein LOC104875165 [Fukomys damarensis]|uniref:uncharacterized protein LOC104875165 n=1 Tax=Fukomys damarensis TaxID=885580 RepID=UPI00053FCCBE|nr:uncharacterized protein LOC104875165 [Fukomys damarensis]